ncbi:hypothetical protein N7528_003376 [Penicillium herquei]|nr:hypothetical protein N7528_003376 [Penicillium herquei]
MGAGPMSKIRTNGAYNWYLKAKRDDLVLPPLQLLEGSSYICELFPGERYCRVRGCDNRNRFASVGNLRVHIREKHDLEPDPIPEQMIQYAPWVLKAYKFYGEILNNSGGVLPELPLDSSRSDVHTGEMERMVRELGFTNPCTRCRQKECWLIEECCTTRGYGKCLHFGLFRPVDAWIDFIEEQLFESDLEQLRWQREVRKRNERQRIAERDNAAKLKRNDAVPDDAVPDASVPDAAVRNAAVPDGCCCS